MKTTNRIYTEEEMRWVRDNITQRSTRDEQILLEDEFERLFNYRRSYNGLRRKALKLGKRVKSKRVKIGESLKAGSRGGAYRVCVRKNPDRYVSVNRYVWEIETGEKLSSNDIILNLNGIERSPKIETLVKITRSENLAINNICDSIPLKTRMLMAKVEGRVANLKGRGDWSSEEKQWLLENAHGDRWINVTERFNAKFDKNRSPRDLTAMYRLLDNEKL